MSTFPLMSELPAYASTSGWSWQRVAKPWHPSDGFWIGSDVDGNRWLTKLRGSFCAYREIVFGRLAQAMNWSCQSSVFIQLDQESAKVLGVHAGEVHAAHWYMDEHTSSSCGVGCVLKSLKNREIQAIEDIQKYDIQHLLDWPKSEFAAYIFGGNEPPGRFFTTNHEFVVIDSEQMFSTGPCPFDTSCWLVQPNGSPSQSGKLLAIEVCKDVSKLPNKLIAQALAVPKEVQIELLWPIAPKLHKSIEFATAFARLHAATKPSGDWKNNWGSKRSQDKAQRNQRINGVVLD